MATDESALGPAGDPSRHLPFAVLRDRLDALPAAPRGSGRLGLVVRRAPDKRRETAETVELRSARGVPGDAWDRQPNANPEAALTVMQVDVATLIANGQPLTVFGDNLFLDLDLSCENLPIGSRVRIGSCLLEVTPKPHNGCRKFAARFGQDALRLVADPGLRHRNLRGIYMRVMEPGNVTVRDPRPAGAHPDRTGPRTCDSRCAASG
jgi:MOSC domain-containing protein YiiM